LGGRAFGPDNHGVIDSVPDAAVMDAEGDGEFGHQEW
tara:strand:+ start:108 stop:218 length:111 start_codon:yes stop_codon:yes gene_type:complete